MTMGTEGAAVIPFDRSGVPAVKEEYVEAIQLWCKTRDTAEILSREEIGAMDWRQRMDVQRKGLVLALTEYYRKHERADVAPGVLALITILSDNENGSAPISQHTLATLFGRSRSSIADAQNRLKKDGLIMSGGRGRYSQPSPVIPRAVASGYNHVVWTISALCALEASANCPAPQDNCQLSGRTRQLNQLTGPAGQLGGVNCPVEPVSIVRPDPTLLLSKNSSTVVDRAAKIAAAVIATSAASLPAAAQPPDPPAIARPAAEVSGKELIDKLHDAGGYALNLTKPIFHIAEVPRNWIAAGCDLELDILPTIRAMTANKPPNSIHVWKYFEASVIGARDARKSPLKEGRPPTNRPMSWDDEQAERKRKLMEALGRPKNG